MSGQLSTHRADEARNSLRARYELLFRSYVTAVSLAGVVVLALAATRLDLGALTGLEPAFWTACALLVVAELRLLFPAGARDANGLVLSTAFVFAITLRSACPP